MSPILIAGTIIVNLALLAFTIGIFIEQRTHRVSQRVVTFLTVGVIFDITATSFMIAGSSRGLFTAHGFLGLSSLMAMLVATLLAWRHRLQRGDAEVANWLHWYFRLAYGWWIVAYITGATLAMSSRGA